MDLFYLSSVNTKKKIKEEEIRNKFTTNELKAITISASDPETDMVMLLKTKCLFQRQLTKMPREYIFRQVFDSKHINLVVKNNNDDIVGGVCYRPFYNKNFVEVVFLAVDYDFQVKGMGGFIMDLLKEIIKIEMYEFKTGKKIEESVLELLTYKNREFSSLELFENTIVYKEMNVPFYIMTYADNFAIGFFRKQGFTYKIKFKEWVGYIKDYEGGTLVECRVFWEINYLKKFNIIEQVRDRVYNGMKRINNYHIEHQITDYSLIKKISDIPGLENYKGDYAGNINSVDRLTKVINYLISDLKGHASAWPFLKPVSVVEVPDYYDYIKTPMDISTMISKLEQGSYLNIKQFIDDVDLLVNNCFKYNGKDTQYYKCAQNLQEHFKAKLNFYKHIIDKL